MTLELIYSPYHDTCSHQKKSLLHIPSANAGIGYF